MRSLERKRFDMYDPSNKHHNADPNKWIKVLAAILVSVVAVCIVVGLFIGLVIKSFVFGKIIAPFILVGIVMYLGYKVIDKIAPAE